MPPIQEGRISRIHAQFSLDAGIRAATAQVAAFCALRS
jgi:hypothetical protein